MVEIPGIPRSLGQSIREVTDRSWVQILWMAVLTIVLLIVAIYITIASVIGGVIAVIIVGAVLGDELAAYINDAYERKWTRIYPSRWF